jgi:hypothetical protein
MDTIKYLYRWADGFLHDTPGNNPTGVIELVLRTEAEAQLAASERAREEAEERCKQLDDCNTELTNGPRCGDCDDTGLRENRVEGKYPCTCITETDFWEWNEAELEAAELQLAVQTANAAAMREALEKIAIQPKVCWQAQWPHEAIKRANIATLALSSLPARVKALGEVVEVLIDVRNYYARQGTGKVFNLGYGHDREKNERLERAMAALDGDKS